MVYVFKSDAKTVGTKLRRIAVMGLLIASISTLMPARAHAEQLITNGRIYYNAGATINPDGTGKLQLTTNPFANTTRQASSLIFSHDGTQLAYVQGNPNNVYKDIIVAKSDGSLPKTILAHVAVNYQDKQLSWSPDGQWLAFIVGTYDATYNDISTPYSIAIVHPDGSSYHTVPSSINPLAVSWLPDSATVAYLANSSLCTVKISGVGDNCKTLPSPSQHPAPGYPGGYSSIQVSPDGTKALLFGDSGTYLVFDPNGYSSVFDVFEVNMDGTNLRNVSNVPKPTLMSGSTTVYDPFSVNQANSPTWSPDGKYIAYGVGGASVTGLYIMNSDGTGQHRIDTVQGSPVAWQPHGDRLSAGQSLRAGQQIVATTGGARLAMQTDGNLVVYDATNKPIWTSGTYGKGGVRVTLQTDGNLVMYNASGAAIWNSQTYGSGATYGVMQSDGNFVLHKSDGTVVWSTKGGKV